jgi:ferredoxin-NADP reductase
MQNYIIKLIKKEIIAENTWLFTFSRPENFKFHAGQYIMLEILKEKFTDQRPKFRAMSIASSPQDNYLNFAMRASESAFKQNIISMEIGDEIQIKGPVGHFLLPQNEKQPIVFLTAGIGITPIRSMLKLEKEKKSTRQIKVFYSNRTQKDIAFAQEMENYSLKNYQYISVLTRESDEWQGEKGHINSNLIQKYLDDIHQPLYYIVGMMSFIKAMQEMLLELKIDKQQIITDNFG